MALDSKYKSKMKLVTSEGIKDTDAKKAAKEFNGGAQTFLSKDIKIFKFKADEEQRVRVLPNMDENNQCQHFAFPYMLHYIKVPQSGNPSFPCPAKMHGSCPSCDYNRYLAFEIKDTKTSQWYRAKMHYFAYIIDLNNASEGPQVWVITENVMKLINKQIDDANGKTLTIEDPENGYDLFFTRETDTTGKKIEGQDKVMEQITSVKIGREGSPLNNDPKVIEEWLDYVIEHPILENFVFVTPDEAKKLALLDGGEGAKQSFASAAASVMGGTPAQTPTADDAPTFKPGATSDVAPKQDVGIAPLATAPSAASVPTSADVPTASPSNTLAASVPTTPPPAPAPTETPAGEESKEERMEKIRIEMAAKKAAKAAKEG